MKLKIIITVFLTITIFCFGQNIPKEYSLNIKKADSLYKLKDYQNSAFAYSKAFKSNGWKAKLTDRYNSACIWALAKYPDSSFYHLNRLAIKSNYSDLEQVSTDVDLNSLHNDKRWNSLLEIVKQNKEKEEAKLNKPLISQLDSINNEDQKYRVGIHEIENKFGLGSAEVKEQWKFIEKKDSINLIKISSILDKYGWLGSDVIGKKGNSTLFLVIQHSDLKTQEKYLPLMREAVKNKKAGASNLAMLEDRVALRQGKKQIYGSQIGTDLETKKYYVQPLEDPDNVDKRRAEVGLPALAEYLSNWQITWDIEQYKKDLPKFEELQKAKGKEK